MGTNKLIAQRYLIVLMGPGVPHCRKEYRRMRGQTIMVGWVGGGSTRYDFILCSVGGNQTKLIGITTLRSSDVLISYIAFQLSDSKAFSHILPLKWETFVSVLVSTSSTKL